MKFTELTVSTTSACQELVADIMWNYTNYGVAISDVLDVVELLNDRKSTWDYVDDAVLRELNSNVTLVKAYIPLDITDETVKKIAADLDALKKNCAENPLCRGHFPAIFPCLSIAGYAIMMRIWLALQKFAIQEGFAV